MGVRTGKAPSVDDTFLWRICHAIDMTPQELAKAIKVSYRKELQPLLAPKNLTVDIDLDPVWWEIFNYVSERIAMSMAVRDELNRQLQKDRARRIKRHEQLREYHKGR